MLSLYCQKFYMLQTEVIQHSSGTKQEAASLLANPHSIRKCYVSYWRREVVNTYLWTLNIHD